MQEVTSEWSSYWNERLASAPESTIYIWRDRATIESPISFGLLDAALVVGLKKIDGRWYIAGESGRNFD